MRAISGLALSAESYSSGAPNETSSALDELNLQRFAFGGSKCPVIPLIVGSKRNAASNCGVRTFAHRQNAI